MNGPSVSVVIPTFNRGGVLAETIRMAAAQDYENYEVIIVDQDPEIPEVVQRAVSDGGAHVKLIRVSEPNLPAARNVGVRAASGDVIVFIDDDVVIGRDYVTRHATCYASADIGAVTGFTLPYKATSAVDAGGAAQLLTEPRAVTAPTEVSWVVGCNASYRKAAIIQAGMSDERFSGSAWSEDADLAVRVKHLGYKLLFDPAIRLVHLELPAGGCENRVKTEMKETNRLQLFTYFVLKNHKILGPTRTAGALLSAYRRFALTRQTVLRGPAEVVRRNHVFFKATRRALSCLGDPNRTVVD